MSDNTQSQISLNDIAGLLPLMAAISMVLSISYDFGFYTRIGVSFRELPTELSDHARSVLIWAPIALLISIQILVQHALMPERRSHSKVDVDEALPSDVESLKKELKNMEGKVEKIQRDRKKDNLISWLIAALLLIAILILGATVIILLVFVITLIWMPLFYTYIRPRFFKSDPAGPLKNFVLFGPTVVVMFAVGGYYSGHIAMRDKPQFKLVSLQNVESVKVLRTLNKGVLVSNEDGFVSFRSWESLDSIEITTKTIPFPGFLGD